MQIGELAFVVVEADDKLGLEAVQQLGDQLLADRSTRAGHDNALAAQVIDGLCIEHRARRHGNMLVHALGLAGEFGRTAPRRGCNE